jgi:CHAT domain-containing protein
MLLGPVADQLGTKRLLIVAEGALQYLPFGALPAPAKGDAETRGRGDAAIPLIVEHEIVSLPSASALAVLRREIQDRKAAGKTVAVLADPVFEADDPRVMRDAGTRRHGDAETEANRQNAKRLNPPASPLRRVPASPSSRVPGSPRRCVALSPTPTTDLHRALRDVGISRDGLGIPRLLSTRQEAEAIMSVAPAGAGMKATDFKASRTTATSPELGQFRIVHFATHGLLNSENPELSGLVLSLVDEQGKPQDGFLRLHDIYNLNLPADLVVLSACNTALGKEVRGEGLVGIVRGFMYAGAARVVASLWKVDDEATAELMKRFYEQMLQRGMTPAAALRAAQVDMWQQKKWRSPYYWAAFVLQGEWR